MADGASLGMAQYHRMRYRLRDFGLESRVLVKAAMEDTEDRAVTYAKVLVPVRSGALQSSIKGKVSSERGWTIFLRLTANAKNSSGREYGFFVEYGTSRMAPQPFLGPAIEQAAQDFEDNIDGILGRL